MKQVTYLLALFTGIILIIGCTTNVSSESFGEPITEYTSVPIRNILSNPGELSGKTVTVSGKIVRECPSGCWFNLNDTTGEIYVDIKPSGFAIPQMVGKKVVVQGTVSARTGNTSLIGQGVELQ
ncbi:MAG: DUF4920 domain-containing protein [Candidatus Omnitrophica bacterium]|nr:DUF4920 domain-containing protein [Candidatus Omnitrophota bacterium]